MIVVLANYRGGGGNFELLTNHFSFVNINLQIRVVRDGKEKGSKAWSRTAGLSAIQLQLNSSARAVREVAAGSAFYDTLPREEKRKVTKPIAIELMKALLSMT